MKYQTKRLQLSEIIIDQTIQPRKELYPSRVTEIAEAYAEGKDIPPIKVHQVDGDYYACDGFHRYAGACKAQIQGFECRVRMNSTWGALTVDAIRSNAMHGQPLTQSEKRSAITKLINLTYDEGAMTQEEIADICGVSQATVSRVVKSLKIEPARVEEAGSNLMEEEYPSEAVAEQIVQGQREQEEEDDELDMTAEVKALTAPAVELCNQIYQAARKISEWLHELGEIEQEAGALDVHKNMSLLVNAKTDLVGIKQMSPKHVCPHCSGSGCRRCLQMGWVTEGRFKAIKE